MDVEPCAQHSARGTAYTKYSLVGDRINAEREAADDTHPGTRERSRDSSSHTLAVRRRTTRSDDGDDWAVDRRSIALRVQHARGFGQTGERLRVRRRARPPDVHRSC